MAHEWERGTGGVLSDVSGRARMTLLGMLSLGGLILSFLVVLHVPAVAFVGKGASCSASGCHVNTNAISAFNVSVNGAAATTATVAAGGTFELDWTFTSMANGYGVGVEVAVPTGWTVARGTSNTPTVTGGWNSAWDQTDGVTAGWGVGPYDTSGEFAGSPQGYSITYAGTSWDTGNRDSAYDDGSAGKDLDGTANKMGVDARITVPAGTVPGTYTVVVLGIGHDASRKAHDEQAITVTVTPSVTSTSPSSMSQGTGPTTVTITGTGFTNTGLSVSFSGSGVTAGTATYVSATSITVPVTVAAGAATGARDVTVTCSGQSGTGTGKFTVTGGLTSTTTTVSNPSAITYGQSASFTATVATRYGHRHGPVQGGWIECWQPGYLEQRHRHP